MGSKRYKAGRLYVRYYVRDRHGSLKQVEHRWDGSEKQAEQYMQEQEAEARKGAAAPARITLAEYLEQYLASLTVSPKTAHEYARIARQHLIPALGSVRLDRLTPVHIQEYYTHKRRQERPLSELSLLHHHRLLSAALRQAVKWRYLPRSPAEDILPPRPQKSRVAALTPEEVVRFLSGVRGSQVYLPAVLVIATGLRRGEMAALKWGDLDLDTGTLRSTAALSVVARTIHTKGRKSGGALLLQMPAFLAALLRQEYERLPPERRSGYVLTHPDGRPWHPDSLTTAFRYHFRRLGMPYSLHSLRHTTATLGSGAGIPVKVLSEMLSHSRIDITMDLYAHVLPPMREHAAAQMDGILSPLVDAAGFAEPVTDHRSRTVACDHCAAPVKRPPSQMRERVFCGRRCYAEWLRSRKE